MKCGFSFDAVNKILLLRFEGALSDELFTTHEWHARRYATTTDFRATVLDFSSVTEFPASSRFIGEKEPVFGSAPRIVVAPDTVEPGLTRWLQVRGEPKNAFLQVVRTMDEALDALGIQSLHSESRAVPLQCEVLDLNAIVSEMGELLQRLLGEKIKQRTVLDPTLAPVKASPMMIEQVIVNLAINARDAMPNGGQLSIETSNVTFEKDTLEQGVALPSGRYVMVAVSDTGVGMDAETLTHIFEPFYTTKPLGKGTGLGLASVWGIIKRSCGYIFVESELGTGTTVKIYLPRVEDVWWHHSWGDTLSKPLTQPWFSVELGKELSCLKYPLFFMVIESASPASQRTLSIPFQWSVHVQREYAAEPEPYEFLATDKGDPRNEFTSSLCNAVGEDGSIVVYIGGESEELSELAKCEPELAEPVNRIQRRLFDLRSVVRKHVYHPKLGPLFGALYDLKSVSAALVPELTYEGMAVADRREALVARKSLFTSGLDQVEREQTRKALLDYCRQETLALVRLLDKLRLVSDSIFCLK